MAMTPGEQLGHYRIIRQIGQGGMGEVYLAEDTRIARQVALKVVRTEPDTQEAVRLFQREMNVIAQLDHPHILSFYDFGEESFTGGSILYMVMPYRSEGSLADWLARRGKADLLPLEAVDHLLTQAADTLQYAHDQNIIHQDVKPSNFLVRTHSERPLYPDLFLVDFGIARKLTATSTASNNVRGTYAYMPPEQWSSHLVPVPATDQYALAIMAYQLLTGGPPFQGPLERMIYQHLHEPPRPPSSVNPCLSPAIDAVILRALAKQPPERFPSITAFAAAFHSALAYTELKATLSVTRAEAFTGASKTITLPGRRRVTVTIPANAQAGQELRLSEQGEAYYDGGPRGPLLLTISTAQTDAMPAPGQSGQLLEQATNSLPAGAHTKYGEFAPETPGSDEPIVTPSPLPIANAGVQKLIAAKLPRGRLIALVAVALLIIISSIIAVTVSNNIATNRAYENATATAFSNANATNIAVVNDNLTATAANDTATATTNAIGPTATASAIAANPDPYSPKGKLALLDPLTQPGTWSNDASSFGGQCEFINGTYQLSQLATNKFFPCNDSDSFSNFTFEVQMTIIQGDCGGLTLRYDGTHAPGYVFFVCGDGTYQFARYDKAYTAGTSLVSSLSTAMKTGPDQSNVIAVVANGSNFHFYINHQDMGSFRDSHYTSGTIGFIASAYKDTTTVSYQNARVWTF